MPNTKFTPLSLFQHLRRLAEEELIFTQDTSFAFPIHDGRLVETNNQFIFSTCFLSLLGAHGVLPDPLKVLALNQAHKKDRTLIDFLDIFHHHWFCLLYQVWQSPYFFMAYERDQDDLTHQPLLSFVLSLTGESSGQYSELLIRYNHFFFARSRSLLGLQAMLSDYFECPIRIHSFVGSWVELSRDQQSQLGAQNSCLSIDSMLGEKIEYVQNKFCIEIGPLNYVDYCAWSPTSERRTVLKEILTLFVGGGFCFDLAVRIFPNEIPALCLGGEGVELGWVGWV